MFYLDRSASRHDVAILDRPFHDHDRIVQTPLNFLDELLRAATKDQGACLRLRAVLEDIVALSTNLLLLKGTARAEMLATDV